MVLKKALKNRRGAVLIISMIFVLIFSTLAVSLVTMSGTNVQLASNQHNANSTLSAAHSGLEAMQYWMKRVTIPDSTQPSDYLSTVFSCLQNDLTANSITNISPSYSSSTINISPVNLATPENINFEATIEQLNNTLQMEVIGTSGQITRKIRVNYNIAPEQNPIFDYGIATKGPLHLLGNTDIDGLNENAEANVYIESLNDNDALSLQGNCSIAGDVSIHNHLANPSVSNSSSIGGESGQDAIDNHVTTELNSIDFPVPEPADFEHYVENTFDPATDTTTDMTLENIRILPNTNPHFSGHVTLKGIVYIETPNIVEFTGNTDIIGIIIGNGDLNNPSDDNQLIFRGNVDSSDVSQLDATFGDIRQETGTFLLAPGFDASFGGSFNTINGVIAASGIEFFGNAGGTVNGSVINYSDNPMTLDGSIDLIFDRLGLIEIPAGFDTDKILEFQPGTYTELAL